MEPTLISTNTTTASTTSSISVRHKNIAEYGTISFHALRAKFQSNHQAKKIACATSVDSAEQDKKKKTHTKTMPKRITVVAKNISDFSDHLSLKRHNTNTSSLSDIPNSKTAPSLWSNNSSLTVATAEEDGQEQEDEEDEDTRGDDDISTAVSTLSFRAAVPRTGSFVTELSKRLAQSEKKGEPLSHITTARLSAPLDEFVFPMTTSMQHIRKSVPASTSSPSLLKRSTTATSMHSLASTNSSVDWKWLNHPPLPDQQPPLTRSSAIKRARVIQELISTEKSYQTDMELIQEIYMDAKIFSKIEMKQIFINLAEIIAFEKDFIVMLDLCKQDEYNNADMTVGVAFAMMMDRIQNIYSDYCKKHEDAACKIQELSSRPAVQEFLLLCKERIQGRTMCWDLPSLLIKPVQRVLKYPLLLREIVSLTPEFHRDYDQLMIATIEIQQVADHINEIKRRKDLVEHLMSDKKKLDKNVVQGINKKITRRVHRKKQTLATQDVLFDSLCRQFESQQAMAHQFEKDVAEWISKTEESVQSLSDLVNSLESVYGESDGIGLRSMRAFRKLVFQLQLYSVDATVQPIYHRIDTYYKLFKNPSHAIEKRNRKLIDYDRAQHMLAKGEIPDKQLQLSAEAYLSLNAQLVDELPTFMSLATEYFDVVIEEFARVQASYWRQQRLEWQSLTIEMPFGREHSWSSINSDYQANMKRLQSRLGEIITKPQEKMNKNELSCLDFDDNVSLHVNPPPVAPLSSNNNCKKYDSLFSESQPVFQCIALVDYESPEKLQVQEGDLIQIWLPTLSDSGSTSDITHTSTENNTEWWYASLANTQDESIYGWLPSSICERI